MAAVLIAAVVSLGVFYLLILVVGVTAARCVKVGGSRSGSRPEVKESEEAVVAGRTLHGVVGVMTMIATSVGGGLINGTAESIATGGLAWTISPFAITVGLTIGGLVFAAPMRRARYLTMLQPVEEKYGRLVVCLVYLASLCGDIFWTASILSALGTSLSVVIGVSVEVAILVSAGVSILYTMVGQMIAVAYTDVFQLICITVGLVLCVPFIATNDRVGNFADHTEKWTGDLDGSMASPWIDLALAMILGTFLDSDSLFTKFYNKESVSKAILGTIPWQSYFQRVLSVRTATQAQVLSVLGGFGALLFAVPPFLIGAYSTVADWSNSSLTSGLDPVAANQSSMVLPLMLKEFTPDAVSAIALGAVSAAVMSSMDSAVLGSSSMFTHNVYKATLRPKASDKELLYVGKLAIFVVGGAATAMAIYVRTVWGLFVLAADIVYVIVLPQLTSALFIRHTNAYGAFAAFWVGAALRLGAGEPTIDLPAFIKYPYYDERSGQQVFPFRGLAFLASVFCLVTVSWLTGACLRKGVLPACCDVLGAREDSGVYVVNADASAAAAKTNSRKMVSKTDYVREVYLLHNPTYASK